MGSATRFRLCEKKPSPYATNMHDQELGPTIISIILYGIQNNLTLAPQEMSSEVEEPWYLISNAEPTLDLGLSYAQRFCCEQLFRDQKSGVFKLESTGLRGSRVLESGGVVKGSGAIRIPENPVRDWLEGRLGQTFNRPCTHSHCVWTNEGVPVTTDRLILKLTWMVFNSRLSYNANFRPSKPTARVVKSSLSVSK